MFGYIVINKKDLAKEDKIRYKQSYCGLCKALKKNYGTLGSALLSFDMTFVLLLLEDLYNEEGEIIKSHCHSHPINLNYRKTSFSDYCAHMQALLSLFALKDKVKDEGKYSPLLKNLEKSEEQLKKDYPRQYESVRSCIERLDEKESENCQDPLLMSKISADLLCEIFVPFEGDLFSDNLSKLGRSIGRYSYLMDAYDDLEKDQKKNTYNPFKNMEKAPDFKLYVKELLKDCATEAALTLEKLPLDENLNILRNIIYSGMWTGFERKESKN